MFLFSEFIRMRVAENIVNSYRSRQKSNNWQEWMASNPRMAQILADVEMLFEE